MPTVKASQAEGKGHDGPSAVCGRDAFIAIVAPGRGNRPEGVSVFM